MPHVMLADPGHQALGDNDLGGEAGGDEFCDMHDAAPVVFHGHVLQVLLDGGGRNDAGLEFA